MINEKRVSDVLCVVCDEPLASDDSGVVLATGEAFHNRCKGTRTQKELDGFIGGSDE